MIKIKIKNNFFLLKGEIEKTIQFNKRNYKKKNEDQIKKNNISQIRIE